MKKTLLILIIAIIAVSMFAAFAVTFETKICCCGDYGYTYLTDGTEEVQISPVATGMNLMLNE